MSIENSTTLAPAATLTEKELFERFVDIAWQTTFSMGPTVECCKPNDLLRDWGIHGHTAALSEYMVDVVEESDDPASELDCVIEDIESYLDNLKRVRDLFQRLKNTLLTDMDDDDDAEPRYALPVVPDAA